MALTRDCNGAILWYCIVQLFGNSGFKMLQREAINATMLGEHVMLLLPTGAGKSLCFQLPAVCTSGVTVVIEPLVSLINDQVLKLKRLGIPTISLVGSIGASTAATVYRGMRSLIELIEMNDWIDWVGWVDRYC